METNRLQAELLLHRPDGAADREAAAACFHRAIAIARQQGAKSLELRAALGLARLWQDQDNAEVARQMLAGLNESFTEGFDTAEWQQARALLDAARPSGQRD
uniref:hypothetical protein n=1 Tax=Cupriavidus necator TaxID=106590 RepID=UPI003F493AB5